MSHDFDEKEREDDFAFHTTTASTARTQFTSAFEYAEWIKLFPGVDYPREADWMEVRKMFGGGLMAVGMKDEKEGANGV